MRSVVQKLMKTGWDRAHTHQHLSCRMPGHTHTHISISPAEALNTHQHTHTHTHPHTHTHTKNKHSLSHPHTHINGHTHTHTCHAPSSCHRCQSFLSVPVSLYFSETQKNKSKGDSKIYWEVYSDENTTTRGIPTSSAETSRTTRCLF